MGVGGQGDLLQSKESETLSLKIQLLSILCDAGKANCSAF